MDLPSTEPERARPAASSGGVEGDARGALDRQIGRGLRFSAIGQAASQALQFPTTIALARLLAPAEHGLAGMVTVYVGVAYFLADFGLGTAIVQRKEVTDRQLSTLFWVNLAVGLALTAAFAALAPAIAWLNREPRVLPIALALSSVFALTSLRITQYNLLRRAMAFDKLAAVDAATNLGAALGAVGLAAAGFGVWALVGQRVLRALVPVVLLWFLVPFRPRAVLDLRGVRGFVRFGGPLLGVNLTGYAARNGDRAIVGSAFGEHALGLYTRAYEFMLLPVEQISVVVTRVMLSALSRAQDDAAESRRLVLEGVERIAFYSLPAMALFAATAEPLIDGIFGDRWLPAVPMMRVFCAIGAVQSVGVFTRWIYIGQGRTGLMLRWEVISGLTLLAAMGVGVAWGPLGMATALAVAWGALVGPAFAIPGRLIGLGVGAIGRAVAPTAACAALAGAVAIAMLAGVLPRDVAPWVALPATWLPALAVYALAARAARLRGYRELVGSLRARLTGRSNRSPNDRSAR